MIKLRNVSKYYPMKGGGIHYVLKDVSFDIPSNQNIAILGPNGAGKSTLLRMIGGAEAPNSGVIETRASISWPLGVQVGFQGSLTGRQNLLFVCRINGLSKDDTRKILSSVYDFSELGEYFDMPVKTYSSGMRARLSFGLSINFDFDYYLIDELTSVGDATFRKKAKQEFEKIKESSALIFVSHSLSTLRKTCDSAIFLNQGKLIYHDDVKKGIRAYKDFMQEANPSPRNTKRKRKHSRKNNFT
jgi:capsular polysaccharide transport system ATP-binding protein